MPATVTATVPFCRFPSYQWHPSRQVQVGVGSVVELDVPLEAYVVTEITDADHVKIAPHEDPADPPQQPWQIHRDEIKALLTDEPV